MALRSERNSNEPSETAIGWPPIRADVLPAARGRRVAVAGQQPFIADTAAEAWSMAKAAHPDDDGAIMQFVFKENHARIYANRG